MVAVTLSQTPQRVRDVPAFLDGPDGSLAAMWSLPEQLANTGVVLLSAGGHVVHSQSNRWGYRVSRALASEGFAVLRLDYAGTGDSAGQAEAFALDDPNVGDAQAAVDAMRARVDDVVVLGHCYGARAAFHVAAETPAVSGVYAIAPPVRDGARGEGTGNRMAYDASIAGYVGHAMKAIRLNELKTKEGRRRYRRLARTFVTARWRRIRRHLPGAYEDPTPWVSATLLRQLQVLGRRRVAVLFAYGSRDSDYVDFVTAREGRLGALMTRGKAVELSLRDGEVHNMARVALQGEMIDEMVRWVLTRADAHGNGGTAR